jgi:16S rRNA (cytosine967-C5)-methyltransferase
VKGRGIEASLLAWRDVAAGDFASEALRKRTETLPETERTLAASLLYAALRRATLWKHLTRELTGRPLGGMSRAAGDALVIGIAGVCELKNFSPRVLVNALVEWVKDKGEEREPGMVNAVLRRAAREGPEYSARMRSSRSFRDACLYSGISSRIGALWTASWGKELAKEIVRLASMKAYLSLRVSTRSELLSARTALVKAGLRAWLSPLLGDSLRLASSGHPPSLPGYPEGSITPQTESSIIVGLVASSIYTGGPVLDMCTGRGVKALQFLDREPHSFLEGWDLSVARIGAALKDSIRLGIPRDRFLLRSGDALKMEPLSPPRLVILDAPCSGSGTWARHPDGKMRFSPEKLKELAVLQSKLLTRAIDLVSPGGAVLYSTCSLFREENEQVVAKAMKERPRIVEMPPHNTYHCLIRGRPWGNYILPLQPWLDGFFIAVLTKRA